MTIRTTSKNHSTILLRRIDFKAFCFGLTTLGWSGSDKKVWSALMEIGGPGDSQAQYYPHFLSLREFDAAAYDATKEFHVHLCQSGGFKNAMDAWNNGLDKDNTGKLHYPEFKAACKALGFEKPNKDLQSLFSNLITNTKRNPLYLTLSDVDTRAVELLGAYPTMRFMQEGEGNASKPGKTGELTFASGTQAETTSTTAAGPSATESANVEGSANAAVPTDSDVDAAGAEDAEGAAAGGAEDDEYADDFE